MANYTPNEIVDIL